MRTFALYGCLGLVVILLFWSSLAYGAVDIPFGDVIRILLGKEVGRTAWQSIVWQSRLPQTLTAILAGASLAVSGLLLQTLFRNPLAGPSILGISDGANLGVALVTFLTGGSLRQATGWAAGGYIAVVTAAFAGAALVLGIMIYFSSKVRNHVMLLILGIMMGYLASSLISILNYYAAADKVRLFVLWGMGHFAGVSLEQLPVFACLTLIGLCFALLMIKPLNALLLGEAYATNLGVRIRRTRTQILICTGLLTASVTAFCGPVSFIGLAVPHIARLLLGSSNHKMLVPVTLIAGACTALVCNLMTVIPGTDLILPLNAVTPLIGAPVVIYVIMRTFAHVKTD
ncbi:MAG: iron ABC transporter permease [Tannerellaceae bacterium]|nr:iron ABC transporter permease [Tannerellaceae bacterium]